MCGFLGRVGSAPDDATLARLERAVDTLAHRGPNEHRTLTSRYGYLGFRRLSILDLAPSGGQPQRRGDWDVVFNGEIYNYAELRQRLQASGLTFTSSGDAEVVAAWIATYGAAGIADLDGMFALAAVHRHSGDVLLARDRFGIKPLFYALRGGILYFASEARAILAALGESVGLERAALARYFALGLCWGQHTVYESLECLPPGTLARWHRGDAGVGQTRWYTWPPNGVPALGADRDALLGDAVRSAVESHLQSDVPLGVFLSGGIDSGLVASYAVAACKRDGKPLPTLLSVSFPSDPQRDERQVAAQVAAHLGAPHHTVVVAPGQPGLDWEGLSQAYDEPFADSSAIPTLVLAKAAAQHATVWLAGDGGDEAFLGYRHHLAALKWLDHPSRRLPRLRAVLQRVASWLPYFSKLRYRLEKFTATAQLEDLAFWVLPRDPALHRVLTPGALEAMQDALMPVVDALADTRPLPPAQRLRAVDFRFFLATDGLVKLDRASMHHSLEVRVPLLDRRVTDLAAVWPLDDLVMKKQGKQPLRRIAAQLLPPGVADLRKQGFGVPLRQVFTLQDERDLLERCRACALAREWIDPDGLASLLKAWRRGYGRVFDDVVWRCIAFVVWADTWGKYVK